MTKFYSLLMILVLLVSCKNESFIDFENQQNGTQQTNYNFGNSAQRNFHGLVLSTNGSPVSGATITIGNSTVQTNAQGIFVIKNADVKEKFAYVKATKAGFVNGSRTMVPTTGNNKINIMMIPATNTSTVASGAISTVSLPNGTKVKFDGSFKDVNGNAYNGNVNVAMFHLKPSDQYLNELMPGSFLANNTDGNSRIMETYGMLHVQLTGASGQNLQIASGHTAEMTVTIDATQTSTAPATIPLWSFNETTGIWQEEGSATKVGNAYVGNVSHFSWWNCDAQFPQCLLNVHIQNATALPLSNVTVKLFRQNQNSTSAITDGNGNASGIIPAGENLTMKIYDACNNVIMTNNIGPFANNSNNTLPAITISQSLSNTITITGILKDCSGNNVTNGVANLSYASSTNYFSNYSTQVTNGSFSFNVLSCASSQQLTFSGADFTNLQATGDINFTVTYPTTNLGNLTVCTSATEFITIQTDAQPIKYFISPIYADGNSQTPTSVLGLFISSQNATGGFLLSSLNGSGVGTYTSNFSLESSGEFINANGNNLTLQISNYGAVGQYIDFTINGTYTNTTGSHTLSVTGHVIRDN
ncbi:carboxypeptidase regulatory-like domain-containing protein [Chryseobacterium aquaticum]|uniref:Carboxypeptidase regulatory-like domain-containing protein n=1 Tax=Chryseobacterium aquaticum TaxID=452084 RepID=A0A848NAN5_9FLAO|nr:MULTISPECIES: carboxypeptidase-like regulatory domain-containing protein [Chryseobacterium]NMR36052.1 carboxypeptidase regulatory-like domain-containing protein [Chryseobacterium aquaticum]NRQ48143.1 carboxypeptidase regulatory-like domain-containing protein [Chryseobacterium sp. C-204]